MKRVADKREKHLTAEQVRDEVAAGRMIIPANKNHRATTSSRWSSAARARPR
jgi:phosphomethylpyrimidine synthase